MKNIIKTFLLLFFFFCIKKENLVAATKTWTNTSGGAWGTGTNWSGNTAPVANDIIDFSTTGTYTITGVPALIIKSLSVSSGVYVTLQAAGANSLSINGTGATTNLNVASGGSLTLGGGAAVLTLTFATTANQQGTIDGDLILSSNATFSSGVATTTISIAGSITQNSSTSCSYITTNTATTITGNFYRTAAGTVTSTAANLTFGSGSFYNHQVNGSTIPTATWNATSTCNVTGIVATAPTAGMAQAFGNVIWNCASQTVAAVMAYPAGPTTISGNFTVSATNSGSLALSNVASTVNVTGNLNISGGTFILNSAAFATTLNVTGAFNLSGGTFNFTTSTVAQTFKLAGNYNQTGGTITTTGASPVSTLSFTGPGATYTQSAGTVTNALFNYLINTASASLTLNNNINVATSRNFTVTNGTLNIPNGLYINGAGAFTLTSATTATLGIGDVNGIVTGATASGNIQVTGARTYGATANYTYNGTSAQVTGNALTAGNNLTINNSAGVTLSNNAAFTGTSSSNLTLTSGALSLNGTTLTLNGGISVSTGSITGSTTSNLTITGGTGTAITIPSITNGLNNLTLSKSVATTITLGADLTLAGNLSMSANNTLSDGGVPILLTIAGATISNAGTLSLGTTGTLLTFNGSVLQTFTPGTHTIYDVTINSTNSVVLGGTPCTISHDFNIVAGTFLMASTATARVLNVSGAFNLSGGTFNFTSSTTAQTFNLAGNYNQTGGTITTTGASPVSTLSFTGAGATYTQSAGTVTNALFNYLINTASASLTLNNNINVATSRNFTVTNGTLNIPNGLYINGAGAFTLTSATTATLGIGDVNGIVTGATASGNIQVTGVRTYGATANYTYNGTSAQVTGNALTAGTSLTINNSSGVTLSNSATFSGATALTLTSGVLSIGTNVLTISNTATTAITGYSSSSYITSSTGGLERKFTASVAADGTTYIYPIGIGSNYRPFELVNVRTGATTPIVRVVLAASSTGTADGTTMCSSLLNSGRNWYATITSGNFTSATIRITESSLVSSNAIGKCATQNGSYIYAGGTSIASSITSNTGVTLPNYFSIGTGFPQASGVISGSAAVCKGQSTVSYSVTIAQASSYTWAYSGTGATINGTTNPVTIDFSSTATSGNLTVRGVNACGTGTVSANFPITASGGVPATYTVTSTANGTTVDGVSLRWAITQANANSCAHDIIKFNLGAGGPFTINLTTALPNLTDNAGVTIDGWDNSGNNGTANTVAVSSVTTSTPMNANYKIILGNSALVPVGLKLASSGNIIRGLTIPDFGDGSNTVTSMAIDISGNNNQVLGCYLGINNTGTTTGTKTVLGINISGANNTIGDGTAAGANLISTGTYGVAGVAYNGSGSTGNNIKGNIIGGLQKDGSSLVSSSVSYGVLIENFSTNNTVGGSSAGEGNVISGCYYGVYIWNSATTGSTVLGNIIGLQADGSTIVSSNPQNVGIYIQDSPNNTIGGSTVGAKNIISGNGNVFYGNGIEITGSGSTGNVIKGNYIGPDKTGTAFITSHSQLYGISINSSASNNIIGGSTAGERNIISANINSGIYITGTNTIGNIIKGNYIGTDVTGTSIITSSTQNSGVYITTAGNTIGGSASGEGNLISGNSSTGINIWSLETAGNSILGNIIGPQANGTSAIASSTQQNGISLQSSNNIVGGSTAGARNTISANTFDGIWIVSTGNVIKGNYIGIDKTGTSFVTGSTQVIGIISQGDGNTIGGSASGEGNVISGNTGYGIELEEGFGGTGYNNRVLGNIIGLQADGTTFVASSSQSYGVQIRDSRNNTIGGSTAGERNIISGNSAEGVRIWSTGWGSAPTGNRIKGNYIGLAQNGSSFVSGSSQSVGIDIFGNLCANNTIGGSNSGEGNVISGNTTYGVYLSGANNDTIIGNIIGPQANGTSFVTSSTQITGITILDSQNNVIGGSTSAERNIISANSTYGINFILATSNYNKVKGNYIGSGSSLSAISGADQDYGVYISSSAANNYIGGSVSGEQNIISNNTKDGIFVFTPSSIGNLITKNLIYSNTSKAINLNYGWAGNYGNNGKAIPVISTATSTTVSGTSGASDVIEVFKNTSGSGQDATTYLGTTTANGSGAWSLTTSLASGDYVIANATDASNNTSEFSSLVTPTLLPIELVNFDAIKDNSQVDLTWTTATEINNDFFTIERSKDALNFTEVARLKGAGNTDELISYSTIDMYPLNGISYYRLKQTDFDGKTSYSSIRTVSMEKSDMFNISVNPNPTTQTQDWNVSLSGLEKNTTVLFVLRDVLGNTFFTKNYVYETNDVLTLSTSNIPAGIYFIEATSKNRFYSKKLVVQ